MDQSETEKFCSPISMIWDLHSSRASVSYLMRWTPTTPWLAITHPFLGCSRDAVVIQSGVGDRCVIRLQGLGTWCAGPKQA